MAIVTHRNPLVTRVSSNAPSQAAGWLLHDPASYDDLQGKARRKKSSSSPLGSRLVGRGIDGLEAMDLPMDVRLMLSTACSWPFSP